MNLQGDLFPTQPLHEAIRPGGNRDEAGARGEQLHQLADAVEKQFPKAAVFSGATATQIWLAVDDVIKTASAENALRSNHQKALSFLENQAQK